MHHFPFRPFSYYIELCRMGHCCRESRARDERTSTAICERIEKYLEEFVRGLY